MAKNRPPPLQIAGAAISVFIFLAMATIPGPSPLVEPPIPVKPNEIAMAKNGCPLPGTLPVFPIFPEKITSQLGQDGVIRSIFNKIGTTNRFFVEFGFVTASYHHPFSGANTFQLYEAGWRGLLMDGTNSNETINLQRHLITPANIVGLFEQYKVPKELDYLSVDIDSFDLWVLRNLLLAGYKPRAVSIEYNSNFPSSSCATVPPEGPSWNGTKRFGASLGAIARLAEEMSYGIVHVEPYVDVFLIPCELFSKFQVAPLAPKDWENATCLPLHLGLKDEEHDMFWDYCEWLDQGGEKGGNAAIEAAKAKAKKDVEESVRTKNCLPLFGPDVVAGPHDQKKETTELSDLWRRASART